MKKTLKKIELIFEFCLWNFRLFVLFPVLFGLLSTLKLFVIGTLDVWSGFSLAFDMKNPEGEITSQIVSYIIGGIDYYLIGIVLLIFSFGIYELFISKIDFRLKQEESNILQAESLEELKGKLVQVIVVALIVNLFKKMLSINIQKSSDIAYFSIAILLISVSSYLIYIQHDHKHK